jgi:hypothetical protein
MTLTNIAVGLFLSFYWNGWEMVSFHRNLDPVDQPGYLEKSKFHVIFSAIFWPFVAWLNGELWWFFVCFISKAVVYTFLFWALVELMESTMLAVALIAIARVVPLSSIVITFPAAVLASLIWMVIAKPMGARPPTGMINPESD